MDKICQENSENGPFQRQPGKKQNGCQNSSKEAASDKPVKIIVKLKKVEIFGWRLSVEKRRKK
jgi:hypothetical protein